MQESQACFCTKEKIQRLSGPQRLEAASRARLRLGLVFVRARVAGWGEPDKKKIESPERLSRKRSARFA